MRSTLFAILATATFVSAQSYADEPPCARSCLVAAVSIAGCAITDEACQCGSGISAIQSAITPCLLSACNQSDLQVAASVGLAICSVFSASLASVSAATTASVTGGTAKPVVPTTSSIPSSTTSGTAGKTSVPATTSKAQTSSHASSTSKSPAAVSTNAANGGAVMAGMGGLLGLGAAFVAAL